MITMTPSLIPDLVFSGTLLAHAQATSIDLSIKYAQHINILGEYPHILPEQQLDAADQLF